MIECPRCGFSQPKDRYCANCGVDMDNYTPKPLPLWKRFLNNPFSYVAIMAAILISLVVYIQTQPNSRLAQNFAEIVPIVGRAKPVAISEEEVDAQAAAREMERRKQEHKLVNSFHGSDASSEAETKVEPAPPKEEKKAVEALKVPDTLVINFVEVSQGGLGEMVNDAHAILSESVDMVSLVLKTKEGPGKLIKYDSYSAPIGSAKSEKISGKEPIILNYTYSSEDGLNEYGLTIQISLLEISAQKTSVDIESFVTIPGGKSGAEVTANVSGSFQWDNDKTLIISGLLPKARVAENILQNLRGPLQIYESDNFTNPDAERPSEFLMHIQTK